ncbi:hypothetical protein [Emticicia sp. W12TSBA100-4]|uniref:hypothetical protein n=1 Tax=Emticicia sp. W12TSBA100-4 TaxID=3160965 RepID=UPI0033067615
MKHPPVKYFYSTLNQVPAQRAGYDENIIHTTLFRVLMSLRIMLRKAEHDY